MTKLRLLLVIMIALGSAWIWLLPPFFHEKPWKAALAERRAHDEHTQLALYESPPLIFFGDSITHCWAALQIGEGCTTPKDAKEIDAVWQKYFAPLHAANFAYSGDFSSTQLWRMRDGELLQGQPKLAVLLIGTNDLAVRSAEEIRDNVALMLKEIEKQSPQTRVLLLAIFPRGWRADDWYRPRVAEANRLLAQLASERVRFLDIGKHFLEPDGSISPELMPDELHLSPKAYAIWAKAIIGPVKEMLAEAK